MDKYSRRPTLGRLRPRLRCFFIHMPAIGSPGLETCGLTFRNLSCTYLPVSWDTLRCPMRNPIMSDVSPASPVPNPVPPRVPPPPPRRVGGSTALGIFLGLSLAINFLCLGGICV